MINWISFMTALDNEGLMRVSGNQNEVKKLKALLDSGMHSLIFLFIQILFQK